MKKSIVFLCITLALCLSLPVSAAEPDAGIIEGSVINGTVGGSSVAGLEVVLTTYLETDEVGTVTSVTNTEGRFVFNSLATEPGYIFQAMVDFQGAEYYSQTLSLDGEDTEQGVDVTVFDSITNDEAISVVTSHTIVYPGQNSIRVNEYFLFVNDSDRTYIGAGNTSGEGNDETLKFPVAEGATGLTYGIGLMDCCVVANEDGFSDIMPVTPGMREVVYSYEIPYNTSGYLLFRRVNYPTTDYFLMVENGGEIEITGNALIIQEPLHIEGIHFDHITGRDLVKGDTLQVLFPELVSAADNGTVIWLVLIPLLIVTGFGIAYFLIKRRAQPVEAEESTEYRKQKLLTEMARLDDELESGSIEEETYRVMRAATKEQLVELISRSEKGSDRN